MISNIIKCYLKDEKKMGMILILSVILFHYLQKPFQQTSKSRSLNIKKKQSGVLQEMHLLSSSIYKYMYEKWNKRRILLCVCTVCKKLNKRRRRAIK